MKRIKYSVEHIFRASPTILYKFFTTPACLIRWFCDEVDISGTTFTFVWEGAEEIAELIEDIEDEKVVFQWEERDEDEEILEFQMSKSPVTNETILVITEYCDEDELDDQKQYWENQMKQLRQETGG